LEAEERNDNINLQKLYFLNPIINIEEIEKFFNSIHEIKPDRIKHHFMPKDLHLVEKCKVNTVKFFEVAKKYIHPNFTCNMEQLSERTCLIHIRSGDEFGKHHSHPAYVQPPLNYYKKIINDTQDKYDEYIIITEPDLENPCIKLLNGYQNKVKMVLNNVFNDYNHLLRAQSIILSRSSFSDSTIFLNPNIKNIYFWNYGHNLCNTNIIPKHINVYPYNLTEKYILIGEWNHSADQLKLMIEYDIKNIKLNK